MIDAAQLSPLVTKPAHVTELLAYDFDLYWDAGLLTDPHRRVLNLLEEAPPIFWTPRNGGHWMLRSNPKLIAEATEELLRRYSFTVPPRMVRKDAMFHGVQLKAGDRVMLYLPAADLDATEFPNSDCFDLKRENKVHIAFNSGPHRCLGSHLARIELQILYEQMLARLPTFRLDPDRPPTFHGGTVLGVESLHIRWDV